MAMSGSGRRALTPPIRASGQPRARSASTMASLCVISMSCAAVLALPLSRIFAPPTATFSRPMRSGNSWACGWRGRCKMRKHLTRPPRLYDFEPERATFLSEVLRGLQLEQKELPSKYFYDTSGSQLFEQICDLEEYYPTRT